MASPAARCYIEEIANIYQAAGDMASRRVVVASRMQHASTRHVVVCCCSSRVWLESLRRLCVSSPGSLSTDTTTRHRRMLAVAQMNRAPRVCRSHQPLIIQSRWSPLFMLEELQLMVERHYCPIDMRGIDAWLRLSMPPATRACFVAAA